MCTSVPSKSNSTAVNRRTRLRPAIFLNLEIPSQLGNTNKTGVCVSISSRSSPPLSHLALISLFSPTLISFSLLSHSLISLSLSLSCLTLSSRSLSCLTLSSRSLSLLPHPHLSPPSLISFISLPLPPSPSLISLPLFLFPLMPSGIPGMGQKSSAIVILGLVVALVALATHGCEAADLDPFPLEHTVSLALKNIQKSQKHLKRSGINKKSYLDVIAPVVLHFRQFQNKVSRTCTRLAARVKKKIKNKISKCEP